MVSHYLIRSLHFAAYKQFVNLDNVWNFLGNVFVKSSNFNPTFSLMTSIVQFTIQDK